MSTKASVEWKRVAGLDALYLENEAVALTLVPELGGKITSLVDRRSGREWLWTSPRTPLRWSEYGASYVAAGDSGGWDECFPTVAPCPYPLEPFQQVTLPDHGELWSQGWRAQPLQEDSGVSVTMAVDGVSLPYRLERTIHLAAGAAQVEFSYRLTSLSEHVLAFIWSAHPLLQIEPGMRLHLPSDARFNVYGEPLGARLPSGSGLAWPITAHRGAEHLRLDPLPGPEAALAVKLWSEPLERGWAELRARDGSLRFSFDPPGVRRIALWLNFGGWAGDGGEPYYNLGLEPCIGAQDSLEGAILERRAYRVLPAGGALEWSLKVSLDAADLANTRYES